MSLKQQVRYFEKQYLRPFIRRVKGMVPPLGGGAKVPAQLQSRLESLEARVAELEQLIQEEMGLRLSQPAPPRETDGQS